jgi:hypothetical protein
MSIPVSPLYLARLHQDEIVDLHAKIQPEAACINQLLIGRRVRRKTQQSHTQNYTVTEVRFSSRGFAQVFGKYGNKGRAVPVGLLAELEIVEEKP